ncbi:MAG: hypothetical protein ACLPT4_10110 [Verrucomicrobiia bacterium]
MNRIVLDHLWRKSWIIAPLLLMEIFFVHLLGVKLRQQDFMFVLVPVYLGPVLLDYDLRRGLTRALRMLPVTARQIGRAWWVATVGVPALLLAATTAFSAIVLFDVPPWRLLSLNCLMQILLLGSFFCSSSFAPAGDRISRHKKARGWFFVALWVGGPLLFLENYSSSNPVTATICIGAGAILTITGWVRAERVVWQGGARGSDVRAVRSKPVRYEVPTGFGGLLFLLQKMLDPLVWCGLVFVGWMILTRIFHGQSSEPPWQDSGIGMILFCVTSLTLAYVFAVIPVLTHLRFLRALPISASILAATLVFVPSGLLVFLAVVFAAIGENSLVLGSVLAAAAVAVFIPIFVWRGFGTATFSPAFILVVQIAVMVPIFFRLGNAPLMFAVVFAIVAIFLSWQITRSVIRHSSQAYHAHPSVISDLGWMGWS